MTLASELSVTPAEDEEDAIRIADDTIYGLNASVFTGDARRAREVGGRLRSGTVGQSNMRMDVGIAFGGYTQSGIGREGGKEGPQPHLEVKTMMLDEKPYRGRH
jgi:aldehyde dehydrogenase (NAD+)